MRQEAPVGDFVSEASFWKPAYLSDSSWLEHAPFAFWLVAALRPARFVELGTHTGFSYLCFCQAVARLEIPSAGFAVDTWQGDEHAGFYGPEVFTELYAYNEAHYAAFSRLVRSTFDEALPYFEDGSVDLLHIDGYHTYDAVRHDFDTWQQKLSPRAVVLLHDTNFRELGFGVHRLFTELRAEHPCFEFIHGAGLGVVGIGDPGSAEVRALLGIEPSSTLAAKVRTAYARLGAAVKLEFDLGEAHRLAERRLAERDAEIGRLEGARAGARSELEGELTELRDGLSARSAESAALRAQADELRAQLALVLSSQSWRFTALLRVVGRGARSLLAGLRRAFGRG